MPKDALARCRSRRPAGFCQEQTPVLTEQFSSMQRDAFHVSYLSDKIPEDAFHGQALKTVAYLRVSTAQQGRYPAFPRAGRLQDSYRQAHGRVPYYPLQLHKHPRLKPEPLACLAARIWSVPFQVEKQEVRGFVFPIRSGPEKIRHAEGGACWANKIQHLYLPVVQFYFHIPPAVYTNRRESKHL